MTTTKIRLTTQVKGTTPLSIPYTASDGAIGELALGTSDQVLVGGSAAPEFVQLSHLILADIGTTSHADIDKAVAKGTSFPGSPTAGERYFRTDIGMECYYSTGVPGWLTLDTFSATRHVTADSSDASDAGGMDNVILGIGYKPYVTKIESAYIVDNVNNASDHYEVRHSLIQNPYVAANYTTLLSHSTSSDAIDTYTFRSDVVNKAATGADYHYLSSILWTDKTPGSIWMENNVYYKLIVT